MSRCQKKPIKKAGKEHEEEDEALIVNIKDLPFDILRQQINQSSGAERREARKQLLLKMGAKPEKRPYINYKQLVEERKKAKLTSIADYKNERFKRTTIERQMGKYAKNKKRIRKAKKSGEKSKRSSGILKISKSMAKKIRSGK